jgi:hypothetical protein
MYCANAPQPCIALLFLSLCFWHTERARNALSMVQRYVASCLVVDVWAGLCMLVRWKADSVWTVAVYAFLIIPVSGVAEGRVMLCI